MRISEIYLSVQGEGPNVGTPTVFVRFAGCNLRCPGWPCDTPFAIYPKEYRQEWKEMEPSEIAAHVATIARDLDKYNVCLTGGEPFLQNHDSMSDLIDFLHLQRGVRAVECFSNGTIPYPDWIENIQVIMDWKLDGSGEDPHDDSRLKNLHRLGAGSAVKFVCKDEKDFKQALELYSQYIFAKFPSLTVYYGAVWGTISNADLVELALDAGVPWKLNVQIHNYIWDRTKRGI